MADQAMSGVVETASRPPPPQVSFSPFPLPLRFSESFSAYGGQGLEQEARGAIAASAATGIGASAGSLKDPNEKSISRASRKNPSTPGTAPPANPTLNVHPGNGSGRTSRPGGGNLRSFAGGLQY
ncbi:unnamed protein product [Sphagnum jensenii]|uniref:Uncharacterized protein n=1 Tax=Sphagnum jensenii TaxID=128206 RepID=A0ABP0VVJ4_9BRYO